MIQRIAGTLALVSLLALLAVSTASAEVFLCSVQDLVECANDDYCGPPDFGGRAPATFFEVDTGGKKITLLAPEERRGETTEITSQQKTQAGWLLAGIENERSWSMLISNGGDVTISITMDGAVWSGFGKWMSAEHVRP